MQCRTIVAITDLREGWPPAPGLPSAAYRERWRAAGAVRMPADLDAARKDLVVQGGYMERLPLACVKHGIADYAEKWIYSHLGPGTESLEAPLFGCRSFHLPDENPPFHSPDMLAYLETFGAPDILCLWGLGVSEEVMLACRDSFKVYYSIDVSPLRVPPEVSRHFDLILAGGEWQRNMILAAHPDIPCEILTPTSEFASPELFRPLNIPKEYDFVYVACAQFYKRHDILFHAMARCSRSVRLLCVVGYGDDVPQLRDLAKQLGITVDFVGPPGVSYEETNYHMNRARVGIVAGIEDGCPSIITEYMLAGIPVLANSELCCGLRFISAQTGMTTRPEEFHVGIETMLDNLPRFEPRPYAIEHYGWQTSVRQFARALNDAGFACHA